MRVTVTARIRNAVIWVLERTVRARRGRKLRAEVNHLALHAFYAALDEIESLEALLENERKQKNEILVESRVAADKRRALDCAVAGFVDAFDNNMLALHEAHRFTEMEVSSISWLLQAAGRPEGGELWERLNKLADEGDDSHDSEDAEVAKEGDTVTV